MFLEEERKVKKSLLKAIGISFLIFAVLSWIIPVGTYSDGKLSTDGIDPVGLVSLFTSPVSAFITFALYGVVFVAIGGFYGVLEKTGALEKLVLKVANLFKGKEKLFIALTVIHFAVLSSLTGLIIPLFILVPLYAAILSHMNYDKMSIITSTVGAILVGSVASTYGFNITGYTKNILSLSMDNEIVAKLILLVILTACLIFVVLKNNKKKVLTETVLETLNSENLEVADKKTEVKKSEVKKSETKKIETKKSDTKKTVKKAETKKVSDKPVKKTSTKKTGETTKKTTKKTSTKAMAVSSLSKKVKEKSHVSIVPLLVILSIMLILVFVGMYNWYYAFGISIFNDVYSAIMNVKIGDFAIFEHLFAGSSQFGYWSNVDLVAILIFTSGLIAWIYRVKFSDYVDSFIGGAKKWLATGFYAAIASVILSILYSSMSSGTGTLVDTIYAKVFGMTDDFNVIFTGVASLIGSFFYNDLYYLLADISSFVSGFGAGDLKIAGLLIQSVYSIGMLIFPTSVVLIAGLSVFKVSYKEWMKYIWKFVLIAFLIVLLVCGILTLL